LVFLDEIYPLRLECDIMHMKNHNESFVNHSTEVLVKQYTIRGVPRAIEKMIEREADRTGLSINKAFISLLEKALLGRGVKNKKKKRHEDLDGLFGVWEGHESEEFEDNLKSQREIDGALWTE